MQGVKIHTHTKNQGGKERPHKLFLYFFCEGFVIFQADIVTAVIRDYGNSVTQQFPPTFPLSAPRNNLCEEEPARLPAETAKAWQTDFWYKTNPNSLEAKLFRLAGRSLPKGSSPLLQRLEDIQGDQEGFLLMRNLGFLGVLQVLTTPSQHVERLTETSCTCSPRQHFTPALTGQC